MKRRTRIAGSILIALVILVVSAIVTMRVMAPAPSGDFIDFAEMKRSGNDALACAPGLCFAKVDLLLAPVPVSAADLVAKIKALPSLEPRTVLVAENDAELRYVLAQHSAVLNIPDVVNIAIQPLDASHTAIAIYSRGRSSENMERVQRWLDLLGVAVVG